MAGIHKDPRVVFVGNLLHEADRALGPGVYSRAERLLEKLDLFDSARLDPPGQPQNVPAYGGSKIRKVVKALIAKPKVLYGVLGIIRNLNIAGPWEHKVMVESGGKSEFWFRCDARRGGAVARITPLDKKRGNTQCWWEIQNRGFPSKPSGNASDLAEAMTAVDVYLGVQKGYILVPGFKEA